MDLSRLMSRLAAIGGMQGAVTEAEEKVDEADMGQYDAVKSSPKGKDTSDWDKNFREKLRQYGDELEQRQKEKSEKVDEAKKPDDDNDGVPNWADKKPGADDNEENEVKESALDLLRRHSGIQEAAPVNYDKVLDAIAALHGDDMWNNDAMQDLANDLEQQNPTEQELDFIIAKGQLPQRLANTQFTNNDSVKFGEGAMSTMRKLAGITECGEEYADMSPMSVTGTEEPGMGVPAQVMSMDAEPSIDDNATPKAKYTLSIQNGENNLSMTTDMPDEIIHIMKLAGVNKDAEVTKTAAPEEEQSKAPKQEVEEEWGNTPAQTNEREPKAYGDIRDWGMKGTGAGKPGSAMNKPSGQGDNPLGEQAMMEAYKKFKASK